MADDDLPDELEKLEIGSNLPIINPIDKQLAVNPFFDNGINNNNVDPQNSAQKELFGATNLATQDFRLLTQNCQKYHFRRRSESVLDELRSRPSYDALEITPILQTSIKVHKNNLKKNVWSGGRKVIIREPILRALQTCFHIQSTARRKSGTSAATSSDHGTLSKFGNDLPCSKEMSNFRDLINECQTMLHENVAFGSSINNSNTSRKNFTSMQEPKLTKKSLIAVTQKSPQADNSISSRVNTSCSQQAATPHPCTHSPSHVNVGGGSATDDVTIDELASYFDTLVHIPKKMSSMAEMMYI